MSHNVLQSLMPNILSILDLYCNSDLVSHNMRTELFVFASSSPAEVHLGLVRTFEFPTRYQPEITVEINVFA